MSEWGPLKIVLKRDHNTKSGRIGKRDIKGRWSEKNYPNINLLERERESWWLVCMGE